MSWAVGGLSVETVAGPVEHLLDHPFENPARPTVRICRPDAAALVLGSTQPLDHVDAARAQRHDLPVLRRRSGGTAVLVDPATVVWLDLALPSGDHRWSDDVGRAAWWVGELWCDVLAGLGIEDAEVHRGAPSGDDRRRRVCFAGVAAGEVFVGARKVVGIAQRRTRALARFQTMVLLHWDGRRTADLVGLDDDLDDVAVGLDELLGRQVTAEELVEAVRSVVRRPAQPV